MPSAVQGVDDAFGFTTSFGGVGLWRGTMTPGTYGRVPDGDGDVDGEGDAVGDAVGDGEGHRVGVATGDWVGVAVGVGVGLLSFPPSTFIMNQTTAQPKAAPPMNIMTNIAMRAVSEALRKKK
jgi:hypothetical protein